MFDFSFRDFFVNFHYALIVMYLFIFDFGAMRCALNLELNFDILIINLDTSQIFQVGLLKFFVM